MTRYTEFAGIWERPLNFPFRSAPAGSNQSENKMNAFLLPTIEIEMSNDIPGDAVLEIPSCDAEVCIWFNLGEMVTDLYEMGYDIDFNLLKDAAGVKAGVHKASKENGEEVVVAYVDPDALCLPLTYRMASVMADNLLHGTVISTLDRSEVLGEIADEMIELLSILQDDEKGETAETDHEEEGYEAHRCDCEDQCLACALAEALS